MRHLVFLTMVLVVNGNLPYNPLPSGTGLRNFAAGLPNPSGTGTGTSGAGGLYPIGAGTPGAGGLYPSGSGTPGAGGLYPSGSGTPGAGGLYPSGVGTPGAGGLYPSGVGTPGAGGLYPSGAGTPGAGGLYPSGAGTPGAGGLYPIGSGTPGAGGLYPSGSGTPGAGGLYPIGTGTSGSNGLYPIGSGTSGSNGLYPIGSGSPGLYPSSYGSNCDPKCKDTSKLYCLYKQSECSSPSLVTQMITRRACPATCGSCEPCTARDKKCEAEKTCYDKMPSFCKYALKGKCNEMSPQGLMIRQNCRVSCDICWPCKAPPVYECDEDCKDNRDDCRKQALEKGRCRYSEYSPWMESNCRLSCGFCQKCISPPPIPAATSPPAPPPAGYTENTPSPSQETSTYSTDQVFALLNELYQNETSGTTKKKSGPVKPNADKYKQVCERYAVNQQASLQQQCLTAHNYYRCLHNVPAFTYDDELAASASGYAMKMAERGDLSSGSVKSSLIGADRGQNVGENIAAQIDRYRQFNVYQAVEGWYAEAMKYPYNKPAYSDQTQHFTQLVWKSSTKVGCGLVKYGQNVYIVAHYQAAGNVPMQFSTNVISPMNVCNVKCSRGSCQSHEEARSECKCMYNGIPRCTKGTGCVVFCPKPQSGYVPGWRERCAGTRSCTCNYSRGFSFFRRNLGATCM